jgi:hypothetical protein
MTTFSVLLTIVSAIWIAFEVWLIARDRIQGKGKTEHDRGTRYYNIVAIVAGMTLAGVLNGKSKYFFPGGRLRLARPSGPQLRLMLPNA